MTRLNVLMMAWIDAVRGLWLRLLGVRAHTILTAQGRVRFLEAQGTGPLPPILLVHGLSSAAVDWGPVIRRLRTQCQRVRAVDLPGHGCSDSPTDGMSAKTMRLMLTEALEALMDQPQILIGNSLGGLTAVRMAGLKPEQTLALVLVSPGGSPIAQAELEELLGRFKMDGHADSSAFVDAFLGGSTHVRPDLVWAVRARVQRPSVKQLIESISSAPMLAPEELSELAMPIQLYWGQDDDILGAEHLDFYRAHLPAQTEVLTPEGQGHAPFLEDLDGFLAPVLDFCRRLDQRPPG
jgi:pimeloyl-ACP methyl ester carboxylesterase